MIIWTYAEPPYSYTEYVWEKALRPHTLPRGEVELHRHLKHSALGRNEWSTLRWPMCEMRLSQCKESMTYISTPSWIPQRIGPMNGQQRHPPDFQAWNVMIKDIHWTYNVNIRSVNVSSRPWRHIKASKTVFLSTSSDKCRTGGFGKGQRYRIRLLRLF